MQQVWGILASYFWYFTQWWFWLVWLALAILGWLLFFQRSYKFISGTPYVRHGLLGRWYNLEEHLKEEHPEVWEELQRSKKDDR